MLIHITDISMLTPFFEEQHLQITMALVAILWTIVIIPTTQSLFRWSTKNHNHLQALVDDIGGYWHAKKDHSAQYG